MNNYNDGGLATGYMIGRDGSNGNGCNSGFGGWGGDWFWGIILIALLFNGGWGNGWGNGNGGGFGGATYVPYMVGSSYTDASLQRGFDTQSIIGKLDGINQGLCDGFYAMNTGMLNGFANVGNAICNLGYENAQLANATQMAIMQGNNALASQLASCCCDLRTGQMQTQNVIESTACQTARAIERGFCDTNYAQATNTTAIIQNAHNDTDRVLARLDAIENSRKDEKIAEQAVEIQAYRQNAVFSARIDAATAEILRRTGNDCPVNAVVVQPNTPVTFPANGCGNFAGWGNGFNGCGCNSGCGC